MRTDTKEKIIKALKHSEGHFISGAQLAQELRISRTAVWKQIGTLLQEGYHIEAVPKKGYRLLHIPDLLLAAEVKEGLNTKTFGRAVHFHQQLKSTQETAKNLALKGAPEGTVVVAEYQEAGRGRRGRSWFGQPGKGILFSLILRPALPPQKAAVITLMAGVGAARGIQAAYPIRCRLKWPNDLLIGEKKLGGILTEMSSEADQIHYLVLGIGLNANLEAESFPPEISGQATSLLMELGQKVDRVLLFRRVLEELETEYQLLLNQGPSAVIEHWRGLSGTIGKEVEIQNPEGTLRGRTKDVDEEGALLLEQAGGQVLRITTGDVVHLR